MKPTIKKVFNYHDMVNHINQKYNVYIDDFAGKFMLPDNKRAPHWFVEWTKTTHNVKDIEELSNIQINDNKKYALWLQDYQNNYEQNEPPYQNFWHFILDDVVGEIHNGTIHNINFSELKTYTNLDWQLKIIDMFITEFGNKTISIEFNW
jgi:hypothetical protein